jgi:uncharacterized protein
MAQEQQQLNQPWFVAVWPGMGHVAMSAGYYLMAKLGMHVFAEFAPRELFDVEHVEVQEGLIRPARLPRSRCFLWRDPEQKHDLILFIGEAQPPSGKREFCQALVEFAKRMDVERVFTFAAMATQMHPEHASRVFGAATDEATLSELGRLDLEVLSEGRISGLNGVLLGEAAEAGLPGICLLGEMPHIFAQLPFPAASLAVLKTFTALAEITFELDELEEQAEQLGHRLGEILARLDEGRESSGEAEAEEQAVEVEPLSEPKLSAKDEQRIEGLFTQARADRSKAYELKQELDRLEVFHDYEDRFLDLFQKPGAD